MNAEKYSVGNHLAVDLSIRKLSLINDSKIVLNVDIGLKIPNVRYDIAERSSDEKLEVKWIDAVANLSISKNETLSGSNVSVFDISWTTETSDEFSDAFQLTPFHWYGGSELFNLKWPFEKNIHSMWSYTTSDIYKPGYGNVMERYWLISSHVAITVDDDVPLLVSVNDNGDARLRLLSRYKSTLYSNFTNDSSSEVRPFLKYKLWIAVDDDGQGRPSSLKSLHLNVVNKYFGTASDVPDRKMFQSPIWTTWARYKHTIDQEKVLRFADEIVERNFSRSQIEIDDVWETHYGDLTFDPNKFPDARRMISELHAKGFQVTVWVHPFADLNSETAKNGENTNYWVQGADDRPAKVEWWNGVGYILDTTNDDAVRWFVGRLKKFQTFYDIDSFKFDAGETNWLTDYFKLKNASYPNQYTTNYAKMASEFGPLIETRCSSRNQNAPNFLRIMDKDSNWTYENGIKTLIPNSLLFGILNRPFILPDIVGGNAYHDSKPDQELFLRWTQANIYLPSMQFSIAPWDFDDDECIEIVRRSIELHEKYSSVMTEIARKSTLDGTPIVRPLWWIGDESEDALTCDDQFLFGDDILVAPVLDPGVNGREVYLPLGCCWYSILDSKTYEGGLKIFQNATISELPYYIKQ